jgi:hypothetical protein
MPEENSCVPFLSSMGFSITARCPIVCPHCIMEAGPHRKEEMATEDVRSWVQQVAAYRQGHIKSIVITGGEPFYNRALLRETLDCAAYSRLVAVVITNAFWATSLPTAIDVLRNLPQIRMLTVSTDVHHQRFIPIENAKNALLAASELGLGLNAAVCFEAENDAPFQKTKAELEKVIGEHLIRSVATFPAGRALLKFKPQRFEMTTEYPICACTAADCPTIFPDGTLICCMGIVKTLPVGHPLRLGNVREQPLAQILDAAERNSALHILRVWGPGRLLKMLEEAGLKERLPKKYSKQGCCDLCYALASDTELIHDVLELTADPELAEKIAYARLFYLNEENMLPMVNRSFS